MRVEAYKTEYTLKDLMFEFALMYERNNDGRQLTANSLALIASKIALETGKGKFCYNWNIGNIKANDSYTGNFCYYACDEVNLTPAQVKAALDLGTNRTDEPNKHNVFQYGTGAVKLFPDHPWARFRAYDSLAEAVQAYWDFVAKGRYKSTIPYLISGNVYGFVKELRARGYFTASLDRYYAGVARIFKEMLPVALEVMQELSLPGEQDQVVRREWEDYQTQSSLADNAYLEQAHLLSVYSEEQVRKALEEDELNELLALEKENPTWIEDNESSEE